jgi:hypothetical protein
MLWAFVQNNANLGDFNRHYSPWSRQTLVQQKSEGGLNAQDFEAHLTALHAKWIFRLLDPRHAASWKLLPFYFLHNSFISGIDNSIFMMDSSFLKFAENLSSRWRAYMKSWFDCVDIAPPPDDFECILNEPIWCNRFLYLKTDSVRGRFFAKATEITSRHRVKTYLQWCTELRNSDILVGPWWSVSGRFKIWRQGLVAGSFQRSKNKRTYAGGWWPVR